MNVTDAKFVQGFVRMCSDGWEQGWHERNGGNLHIPHEAGGGAGGHAACLTGPGRGSRSERTCPVWQANFSW